MANFNNFQNQYEANFENNSPKEKLLESLEEFTKKSEMLKKETLKLQAKILQAYEIADTEGIFSEIFKNNILDTIDRLERIYKKVITEMENSVFSGYNKYITDIKKNIADIEASFQSNIKNPKPMTPMMKYSLEYFLVKNTLGNWSRFQKDTLAKLEKYKNSLEEKNKKQEQSEEKSEKTDTTQKNSTENFLDFSKNLAPYFAQL